MSMVIPQHKLSDIAAAILRDFPGAATHQMDISPLPPPAGNCVAFALGLAGKTVWPGGARGTWWPSGTPHLATPVGFGHLFARYGYSPCGSSAPEADVVKLALYVDHRGQVTHVARSADDGLWVSKLARGPVVRHELAALEGAEFGRAQRFYRRRD